MARIKVRGVVQGVGFRPFVFRLAHEHNLTGRVRNTSGEVEIEIEGDAIDRFLTDLESKAPPMALVQRLETTLHPLKGYDSFQISNNLALWNNSQLVSPDIATCPDCQKEIFDPDNRRYKYPFTNCTNCGPRFTIIEDIPYDRPNTTMEPFSMCPECQDEYDSPFDRRFHAQPNACPVCGPALTLLYRDGTPAICEDAIEATASLLEEGRLIAIKGLGGFLLACDATNPDAVIMLRKRKQRHDKPLTVMVSSVDEARQHCHISPQEEALLNSPQCPTVLLRRKARSLICPEVAPDNKYLGIMLPYTPLHHILLREAPNPLVMTSGNLSGEPIVSDNDEALQKLPGIADYFLMHNRGIHSNYDDSVCIVKEGRTRAILRARSYAPFPLSLPFQTKQVLACGADLKNTFCLTKDDHAFMSQHIGDMENKETLEHFENTLDLYQKLFRIEPEVIAHDMNPEYLSTKYALSLAKNHPELKVVPVQHHHAHIISCTSENGITEPVIGVAFDGDGFGTDGHIWGGEFLVCDCNGFERAGHLEYVPMPGGEAAIQKPYRMALGYLLEIGHPGVETDLPFTREIASREMDLICHQVRRHLNSPLTSSAGRLCDAVAALTGIRSQVTYEAQAAIELEMLAPDDTGSAGTYPFSIEPCEGVQIIRLGELINSIADDIKHEVPISLISARFHNTLAEIILRMCILIRQEWDISRVALSGGVFQNRLLMRLATASLNEHGFDVLMHSLVPANDGGISLGQSVIASSTINSKED